MDEKIGRPQLRTKERKTRGKDRNVLCRGERCWEKDMNTLDIIELCSSDLEVVKGLVN